MKVWIVLQGENGEGCDVVSVNKDKRVARRIALAYRGETWEPDTTEPDVWWCNSCDFIKLKRYEVDEGG